MSDRDQGTPSLQPMDAELRDLLRANAPALVAPAGAEAKLLARLGQSIPGLTDPPGGGGGGSGGAAPSGVGISTGVKAAIGIALGSAALVGIAAFGVGGKAETVSVRAPVVTTITASTSTSTSASSGVPTMNVESLPS